MSLGLVAWAFDQKIADPLAKFLLVSLADRAGKDSHQCWPSLGRIQKDTGISHSSIARKLKMLEEAGFILRTQRNQRSTLYTLNPQKVSQTGDESLSQTGTTLSHTDTHPSPTQTHEPISKNQEGTSNSTGSAILKKAVTSRVNNTEPLEPGFSLEVLSNETFEAFWNLYPKKVAPGRARTAMVSALNKATPKEIIAGAKDFSTRNQSSDLKYLPNPAAWLDGEQWLDEHKEGNWGNLGEL